MIYIGRTKALLPTYTQNCIPKLALSPSSLLDPLGVNKSGGKVLAGPQFDINTKSV